MATDRRPFGMTYWPVCRASAAVVAAFLCISGAPAQPASRPPPVTAVAPEGAGDQRRVHLAVTSTQSNKESSLTGNPLWAVPLDALAETRARPIFSPSRRPAPPAMVAALPSPPPPAPPAAKELEQLPLTLLGTIIGESERIGVFLDKTSQEVIRLKLGQHYLGWVLLSVRRGAISLEKNHAEATLTFPRPGETGPRAAQEAAKPGRAEVCGSGRPEACAPPAVSAVPAATPTTGNAHKTRREI
jgi:general secretion pathway protein N